MDKGVMLSIHPEWLEMIFNEEKGLEFRKKIISTIKPETKIYFYETKKKNGKKLIYTSEPVKLPKKNPLTR